MKFHWIHPAAAVTGLFCYALTPAVSKEISEFRENYTLKVVSVEAGEFRIAGRTDGRSYSAAGVMSSTGLVSLFTDFHIHAGVRGWVRRSGLEPLRYHSEVERRSDVKTQVVNFRSGRVRSAEVDPPRDIDVDPRSRGVAGAIDPSTMAYLTFAPARQVSLCDRDYKLFDGRRLLTISLTTVSASDDEVTCAGTYDLLGGFTEEELQRARSDFTLVFQKGPGSDGMFRLESVTTRVSFGSVKLERIRSDSG